MHKLALVEAVGLAIIMALAAYLRLAHLDYAQMRADDANLWDVVVGFLQHPRILSQGIPSSVGPPNGPFQAYLLLLAAPFTRYPLGAYVVVAVLNIAAVLLSWAFCRAYFGRTVALITALLFALNPWAVIFSRRLWGNDMVPLFAVLLVWSLCNLATKGRRRDSLMPFVWLAVLVQVYVGALAYLATVPFGLILGIRRVRPLALALGAAMFLLLVSPYAVAVIPRLDTMQRLAADQTYPTRIDADSLRFTFQIVGNDGYQAFANQAGSVYDSTSGLPFALSLVLEGFLAVGLAVAFARVVRACRRRDIATAAPYLIMVVPIFLPAALFIRHTLPVYPFYMLVGYPMHFVFSALGVQFLARRGSRLSESTPAWLRALPTATVGVLLVAVAAMQLNLAQVFFGVVDEYWSKSDYGLPLAYARQVVSSAEELVTAQGIDNIYVVGPYRNDTVLYTLMKRRLANVFNFNSEQAFVAPAKGRVLYIVFGPSNSRAERMLAGSTAKLLRTVSVPGDGLTISFLSLDSEEARALVSALGPERFRYGFDGTARLDSGDLEQTSEGTPTLRLKWTVWDDAIRPEYIYYFRLMDNANTTYASLDVPLHFSGQWKTGDQVVNWVELPRPKDLSPGQYWYLSGLYQAVSASTYRNLPVTDASGNKLGDGVRLGPLVVRPSNRRQPDFPLNGDFEGKVALSGYSLEPNQPRVGNILKVELYWEDKVALDRDYSVFLHLTNDRGQIVAQKDSQPDNGRYPTSAWRPGDQIVDPHVLSLPKDLPPGTYHFAAGLYFLPTGERLGGPSMAASFPLVIN